MIFLSNSYKDFNSDRLKSEVLRVPRSKATTRPCYANQRTILFEYDGFDRRVRILEKTYNGTIWITDSDNVFIWDGSEILQKRDSTGSTVVRSYFGNGFEEDSVDYYYTKDHLGSIREVVAADGATVHAVYDYSPWGEVTGIGDSSVASDFLYTGHYFHAPSNLFLTHYRAYDPELGKWLSRDPIAENGGINLYAYVGNDPVNFLDYLGLETAVVIGGKQSGNPFGHVSIATTGSGIYSTGTAHAFGSDFVKFISDESKDRNQTVYILDTTPEQEQKILDSLKSSDKKLYNKYNDNCSNRTSRALKDAEILNYETRFPAQLQRYLEDMVRRKEASVSPIPKDTKYIPPFFNNFSPGKK